MVKLRKASLIVFVLIISHSSFSQDNPADPLKIKIKHCAEQLANGFVTKDYATVIKYLDPNLIKMAGGEEQLIKLFQNGLPGGAQFHSVQISNLSDTIMSGGEIQCTLTQTIKLRSQKGTILTKSTLIGISKDNGENWYFIDASRPLEQLRENYPNISRRLTVHPRTPPVLLDN
jgi:hypothetical protein